MDRQSLAGALPSLVVQLLNDLRVQHPDDIGQRSVIIGNDRKDRRLLISDSFNLHIVMVGNVLDLLHIERRQSNCKGHVYAFRRFAGTLLIDPVLLHRNMIGIVRCKLIEQQIKRGNIGFFFLPDIRI